MYPAVSAQVIPKSMRLEAKGRTISFQPNGGQFYFQFCPGCMRLYLWTCDASEQSYILLPQSAWPHLHVQYNTLAAN